MSFWGTEVKPDKVVPFVPPPQDARLHISQACLAEGAGAGAKSALKVKVQDGPELYVCRLSEGRQDFANLDLVLDEYTEFTVEGAALHITGYLMPEEQLGEEEEEDEEMDEEYTPEMAQELMRRGFMLSGAEEYDSEGSDSDEDDDYEGVPNGMYDEDESDEEESDDSDEADGFVHRSSVIIEEVQDGDHNIAHVTSASDAKVEDPISEEPESAAQSSKKRKADVLKDAVTPTPTPTTAIPHPSKKQAKVEPDQKPTTAAAPASTTAKQKRTDKPAAAAAEAAATKKKTDKAAAAEGDEAPLSKSQLKKQRKRAQGSEEAATAASASAVDTPVQAAPVSDDSAPKKGSIQKWENGFQLERLVMGKPDGKLAKPGKKVVMRYRGSLQNGKVFDETKGNKTFSFRLGVGEVIKGWDRGVAGMRVGDKRKLTVPPQMGYGSDGVRGSIPPNATLLFNVELVDVK